MPSLLIEVLGLLLTAAPLLCAAPPGQWHLRNPIPTPTTTSVPVRYSNGVYVGTAWLPEDKPNIRSVAYGAGRFVGVGDVNAIVSTDGRNWLTTTVTDPLTPPHFTRVIFGNGLFVAVCTLIIPGRPPTQGSGIMTSEDGVKWSWVYGSQAPFQFLEDIVYGNGSVGARGSRRILRADRAAPIW